MTLPTLGLLAYFNVFIFVISPVIQRILLYLTNVFTLLKKVAPDKIVHLALSLRLASTTLNKQTEKTWESIVDLCSSAKTISKMVLNCLQHTF